MLVLEWLRNSVEWRLFGLNIPTLTFLATLIFTFLQCAALYGQARTIERARSGESVSVPLFSYMVVVFIAFGYYGAISHSVGSVVNGTVGLFYFFALTKLKKFKGFSSKEKKLMVLCVALGATEVALPWKATIMTILMGGATLPFIQQVREIRRNRSIGAIDIRFVVVFTGSLAFWTGYAFSTRNVPLMIVNPPMFFVLGAFYFYWYKYRERPVVLEAR